MLHLKRANPRLDTHGNWSIQKASVFVATGFLTGQILRLLSNIILTRILVPEFFGIMTIVNLVIQGMQMFSDVGIGPSIIQNKNGDDPKFLNTAWTIQVIRGALLWLVACAMSWPISRLYSQPDLCMLICVSAFAAILSGFNSTSLFTANRNLLLGRLVAIDLVAQALSLLLTIAVAFAFESIWALVVAGVATSAVKAILSHIALPGLKNEFQFNRDAASQLFSFGKWIFLSTLIGFIGASADRLYLGLFLNDSIGTLGVYSIAYFLSFSIAQLISGISQQVFFPAFSKLIRVAPTKFPEAYYRTTKFVVMPAMALAGCLIIDGDLLIGVLYDDRYREAGWMFRLMAIRLAFYCTLPPAGAALLAIGKPIYSVISSTFTAIWVLIGVPAGWYVLGLQGVVLMIGLSAVPLVPVYWIGLARNGIWRTSNELLVMCSLVLGLLFGLIVRQFIVF